MKDVIVHWKKRVFDGFFKIDEAEVSYVRFDGRMSGPVRRLCFERGDSVAAVLYDPRARRAVFVRQFKYPTYEKGPGWILETVAGMPDPGETAEAALRREALEELGYELRNLEPIATFYVSPGGSSERILLYYAEIAASAKAARGGGVASEGEDVATVELSIRELERLLEEGGLEDAKTIIGIQWLLRRLEKERS